MDKDINKNQPSRQSA